MAECFAVRLREARQLVCVTAGQGGLLRGADQGRLSIVEGGTLLVDHHGRIADLGPHAEVTARHPHAVFDRDVDCRALCVVPGLCDAHTHPVWAGDRVHEFAMKLAGATYMDIHAKGGGIGFTVGHTRNASEDELLRLVLARLDRMLRQGSTLVEGKSGYGLETDTEMKLLRVLHRANTAHPVDVVSSFLGAHSVPKGSTAEEATVDVVERQLPELARLRAAGLISPTLVDVFLEKGVFDAAQTERILRAGAELGLEHNFHGDEINFMTAGELAGRLRSLAVSHLEKISPEGIAAMALRPSVAVLLPTTAYILRLEHPPARALINAGVPVALGSDFNPNAHCLSMPLTMHLACVNLRLSMPEALVAATINAAASMACERDYGSLEVGKWADAVLVAADSWEHLVYEFGDPPIAAVLKKGRVVFERADKPFY